MIALLFIFFFQVAFGANPDRNEMPPIPSVIIVRSEQGPAGEKQDSEQKAFMKSVLDGIKDEEVFEILSIGIKEGDQKDGDQDEKEGSDEPQGFIFEKKDPKDLMEEGKTPSLNLLKAQKIQQEKALKDKEDGESGGSGSRLKRSSSIKRLSKMFKKGSLETSSLPQASPTPLTERVIEREQGEDVRRVLPDNLSVQEKEKAKSRFTLNSAAKYKKSVENLFNREKGKISKQEKKELKENKKKEERKLKEKQEEIEQKLRDELEEKSRFNEMFLGIFEFDLYGKTEAFGVAESNLRLLKEKYGEKAIKQYHDMIVCQKDYLGEKPLAEGIDEEQEDSSEEERPPIIKEAKKSFDPCKLHELAEKSSDAASHLYSHHEGEKTKELFDEIEQLFLRSIKVLIHKACWENKKTHQNIRNIVERIQFYRGQRVSEGFGFRSFGHIDSILNYVNQKEAFISKNFSTDSPKKVEKVADKKPGEKEDEKEEEDGSEEEGQGSE